MKQKFNLSEGIHDLIITHHKIGFGKVTFVFRSVEQDANEILRTFVFASDALKYFLLKLTGKQQLTIKDTECKLLHGTVVKAEIIQSKNPKYMNLARVIDVYNNTQSPFIELKTTEGNLNVGQTEVKCP